MAAEQDDRENWTRITLRLPPRLHERLIESAGGVSLNATIVRRLEESLSTENPKLKSYEDVREAVSKELREEFRKSLFEAMGLKDAGQDKK